MVSKKDKFEISPYDPEKINELLVKAPFVWWVAGGWALDLFIGKQTRTHYDIDVAIARADQAQVRSYLSSWNFQYAESVGTSYRSWESEEILEQEVHGVWARETPLDYWRFEFLLHEIEEMTWSFRYFPNIKHSVESIGGRTSSGIPYLRPEIVLLYKAARLREVDVADFLRVLPLLDKVQLTRLIEDLSIFQPDHSWLKSIEECG